MATLVAPPASRTPSPTMPPGPPPAKEMVWIPGGGFRMGADDGYPEEAPARTLAVDGFWIDRYQVTNARFRRFVKETGYVTLAERAPDPAHYPDARPELLVPGSVVFRPPAGPVALDNHYAWWDWQAGASWRHPEGPGSTLDGRDKHPVVHVAWEDVAAYAAWAGAAIPTEAEWEFAAAAASTGRRSPGATSWHRKGGCWRTIGRGGSPGRTSPRTDSPDGPGRLLPAQRVRPLRHDRQRLGVDGRLVHRPPRRRLAHAVRRATRAAAANSAASTRPTRGRPA
jgi:formylglycine-generating enzyme required for sulfatase activity